MCGCQQRSLQADAALSEAPKTGEPGRVESDREKLHRTELNSKERRYSRLLQ